LSGGRGEIKDRKGAEGPERQERRQLDLCSIDARGQKVTSPNRELSLFAQIMCAGDGF
jgi:hypothetical protein